MALQQEFYPIVQSRTLPEGAGYYIDVGCELAPACLECPLPACRYDEPTGRAVRAERDTEIREMYSVGFKTGFIASHFDLSARTIYRITDSVRGIER